LPKWLASSFKENETRDPFDHSIFDIVREHALYAERLYDCNGRTRIAIPEDATILIEEPFTVYYYPTAKGNIGYLRIAHYDPEDDKVAPNDWFEYYVWALTNMEQNTVGLIIDQDHNCGGDLILLEEIASLFMDEAFEPLKFELRASKRQILDMKRRIDNFKRPYHLYRDALLETYNLLLDSFEKGEYLTPKIGRRGSKKITPRNIYTKPVIILIDYFAASGGDMFPALLQGLGRAKLLGTATAGLGGSVVGMTPLFYSQIRTDMTQSLFYRPDGVAVENNGVDPDIPYEITVNDFVNGYRDYQKFYTDELLKLVQ
jgi:C-terminal processing protease CtpA/Prc